MMLRTGRLRSSVSTSNNNSVSSLVGIRFDIASGEFVLGQALSKLDQYYAEFTQFIPTEEQFIPYLWIENGDFSKVESLLENQPLIEEVTKYDERAGRALYAIQWTSPQDTFISILMDVDCLISEGNGTPERWEFELLARDHTELSDFQSTCIDNNIPVEIQQVVRSGFTSTDQSDLTTKQREILLLAYEQGYFEVPRTVTVADLSKELGITPQAGSKRLRRGLQNIITDLIS